jgi:hypothetical protein
MIGDFFDAVMTAITYAMIAVGLTFAIVFLGYVLNAFIHQVILGL